MTRRTAIITGPGSGIGRATALALAENGYNVVLAGRRREPLEQASAAIAESCAAETLVRPTDVSDPADAAALVAEALERFGRLDALVNIAGYAAVRPVAETDPDLWRTMIDVNVSSVVYLTQAAWAALREADEAIIVNTSSMASRDPFPGFGAYAAAKAAVNMYTLVTGREGAAAGIRAVAIAPGAVETPMLRGMFDESTIAPNQALAPSQVAALIVDCVTGRRAFEPGQTLFISR